ncbi:hypothetical protein Scep_001857 [Stephania cephalantha]|uniref:Arginine decarboxylase n=1 Tax=Stephania cephalantha TaxID=152367 RepID=A0AAP0L971_9MAGN
MRAKLRTKHAGHLGSTSGEKGKFGLTTAQVLRVAKRLETEGMLGCLRTSHFHIGSQIPSIAFFGRRGVRRGGSPSDLPRLRSEIRQAPYHLQRERPRIDLPPLGPHLRSGIRDEGSVPGGPSTQILLGEPRGRRPIRLLQHQGSRH